MPVYVPARESVPSVAMPNAHTAEMVGVATVGGVAGSYLTDLRVVKNTSNLTFFDVSRLEGVNALRVDSAGFGDSGSSLNLVDVFDFYNFVVITMDANLVFTWTPPGPRFGHFALMLKQDAIGGRTAAWPAEVRWPGGIAPVITAAAGAVSLVHFVPFTDPIVGNANLYGRFDLNYTSV